MGQYVFFVFSVDKIPNYTFSGIQQKYYLKIIGNKIQKRKTVFEDSINISEVTNMAISIFLPMWFQWEYFMNDVQ